MPTRNIVVTEQQQQLIQSLVESGRFQNASEVLRDGLRLVQERETMQAAKLEALRQACQVGWSDIDAGRYVDVDDSELDEFMASLAQRAASMLVDA